MTVLAFDIETRMLAAGVEREFAEELGGDSAWSRADLFGFACGVIVDVYSSEVRRFGPEEVTRMMEALRKSDLTVGYNSSSFDLQVLSAHGDITVIRERHVDLCAEVREALADLPEAQTPEVDRLRQGGLDGLAKANGLGGKTGSGEVAVSLYRQGKLQELMDYCEQDVRLTASLYRLAREQGGLRVEAYYRNEHDERRYLPGPVFVQLAS